MSVDACKVPVDPTSTSASPPPPTLFAIAASIVPWNTGACPNEPFQVFVKNWVQERPTYTTVPSAPILSSGSLLPSGRSNGMLVKLSLLDGAACVTAGTAIVTISAKLTKTTIEERILYRSLV